MSTKERLTAELNSKFSKEELRVLDLLNLIYHTTQNIWSIPRAKKGEASEDFMVETQLGYSKNRAKQLIIKFLNVLEKYPYEVVNEVMKRE